LAELFGFEGGHDAFAEENTVQERVFVGPELLGHGLVDDADLSGGAGVAVVVEATGADGEPASAAVEGPRAAEAFDGVLLRGEGHAHRKDYSLV